MAGPLVSGYESDSASEDEIGPTTRVIDSTAADPPADHNPSQRSASKLALPSPSNNAASAYASPSTVQQGSSSPLPPARSSVDAPAPKPVGLSLPPPKQSTGTGTSQSSARIAKRKAEAGKFQIRVESLEDLEPGEDADAQADARPDRKKARPLASGSGSSSHALFGMLPAPKRADEIKREIQLEEERKKRKGALSFVAGEGHDGDGNVTPADDARKGKGNADFRAMLGLKPAASKPNPRSRPVSTSLSSSSPSIAVTAASSSSSSSSPPVSSALESAREAIPGPAERTQGRSSTASAVADSAPEPVNFFSLNENPARTASDPSTSSASTSTGFHPPSLAHISAAPSIVETEALPGEGTTAAATEDESATYKGWQQDPDGTWVPVTPEAQAAYAAWRASAEVEAQMAKAFDDPSRRRTNDGRGGGGFDIGELAKAGLREEDLASIDAASLTAWNSGAESGEGLDARYASAAAEVASGAAGASSSEARKKTDKMTGQRARQKGQLTSLLAHADEKRVQLEQKWAKGKAARQASAAKYGFR